MSCNSPQNIDANGFRKKLSMNNKQNPILEHTVNHQQKSNSNNALNNSKNTKSPSNYFTLNKTNIR